MAITSGTSAVTEVGAGSTSVAATKPTLTANTDVVLIASYYSGGSAAPTAVPQGWTQIPGSGQVVTIYVSGYFKVVLAADVANEPSTYTWSFAAAAVSVIIKPYYGVGNLYWPFDPAIAVNGTSVATSLVTPGLSVINTGVTLISAAVTNSATGVSTKPASMTQVGVTTSAGRPGGTLADESGVTGAVALTRTWTFDTTARNLLWMIALNPTPSPVIAQLGAAINGTITTAAAIFVGNQRILGDILLVFAETCGGEAMVPTAVSGLQVVPNTPVFTGTTTNGTRLTVYWVRAYGTQTAQGPLQFGDAGDHFGTTGLLIRGAAQNGSPFGPTATSVKATTVTAVDAPSITTTSGNNMAVAAMTSDTDIATPQFSAPSNAALNPLLTLLNFSHTLGNGGGVGVFGGIKPAAGAVGTTSATAATATTSAAIQLALLPVTNNSPTLINPRLRDSAQTNNVSFVASQVLTMPVNIVAGDLLIAYVTTATGGGLTATIAGWTALFTARTSSATCTQGIFYKTAAGGDTATVVFNGSVNVTAVVQSYAGIDTSAAPQFVNDGPATGTNPAFSSLTTTTDKCLIIHQASMNVAGITTPDAGMTERGNVCTTSATGSQTVICIEDSLQAIGATATRTLTTTAFTEWYGTTLALKQLITYTHNVQTDITGVTDVVDTYTPGSAGGTNYTDSVTTVVVGLDSETDLLTLTETIVIVVSATSSVADSVGNNVTAQTDIIMVMSETDTLGAVESPLTSISGQTTLTDLLSFAVTVQTDIIASTGSTDAKAYTELVQTDVLAVTSQTEQQAMLFIVQTDMLAITSVIDDLGGNIQEFIQTNVLSSTFETELVNFFDTPQTTVAALSGETDALVIYPDMLTTVLGITSVVEIKGVFETLETPIQAVTSLAGDVATMVSSVLTVMEASTDITESFNGNIPPIDGRLLYQAGPFKVMGKI